VADLEDDLATWMDQRGFERGWRLAPALAGAGADVAWCERVAGVVQGQALEAAFGWITSTVLMTTLLSEVRESTQRISNLVGAVKSYSQLDRASMQQTDVTEGLDSTLVMLGHQLGEHVTVVRDYGADLPLIEAIPGELNQVWTNLVDNAIDAMDGEGVLTLSTRLDGDAIVVGVGDTGPGMSETVQENAFRPFYTTKDVGKGTGLGLDISRRIVVERHGGQITIDSEPGRTVINVRLLISPAA
jgi:signal transduction histidine kinase